MTDSFRTCLKDPIDEIFAAANYLNAAVTAHLEGKFQDADELIRRADIPAIAVWTDSLWGRGGPWTKPLPVDNPLPFLPRDQRVKARMPSADQKRALLVRDGYHCRFCGIPLVRKETISIIQKAYPASLRWGRQAAAQHAGLQALWLQYDHVLPHARGGTNDLSNMIITCAPCNFGRTDLTLEEAGLSDPRLRAPIQSAWEGLERFRKAPKKGALQNE